MGSSPSATINAVNLSMNSWVLCNSYSVSLTTANATMNIPQLCSFTLCPNQRLTVSLCGVGGASACTGNTLVRVLDSSKSNLMAIDDGCSSSSSCSYGQYVASSSSSCGTYYLAEGCYGMTTGCGGQPALYLDYTPTASPTVFPTIAPSPHPTSQPTRQPSSQPSGKPSAQPSSTPSSQPSDQPSSQPSNKPSAQPSSSPSGQPSDKPSSQPSGKPSAQPSSTPSSQPSDKPSSQPSSKPSTQPSSKPSSQPSDQPSSQPSNKPSAQPSSSPSSQPSDNPSAQPSSKPSTQPSSTPSSQPSSQPSNKPSAQPSSSPSGQPSDNPSAQPSSKPSTQPSSTPSSQPSSQPSNKPSAQPSSSPSGQPSDNPSAQPSSKPSTQPSNTPSSQPSSQPSNKPSAQPSSSPSGQPSDKPSSQPSGKPSTEPSSTPSSQPSDQPSSQPSNIPSAQPSSSPSGQPSDKPSSQPSGKPSTEPSSTPSSQPSDQPSSQPSNKPSAQPSSTPSGQPSDKPSSQPSGKPSTEPSSTPSSQPSDQPSSQPSNKPSSQPSRTPSSQPSDQPSGKPTAQPSGLPSIEPSGQPSVQPSSAPSKQPTSQPSSYPSSQPTCKPLAQPSKEPSSHPTAEPSQRPSPLPSSRPTRQPTAQPSSAPSRQPTAQPSTQPSRRPTSQPSSTPSRSPSAVPSRQPSSKPTVQPSSGPSGQPTSRPTKQPSSQPSRQPTSKPSSQPTRQPNSRPSSAPTWQPSSRPSSQPSSAPTTQPTSHPTGLIGSSVTTVVTSNSSTATVSVSGQSVSIGGMSSSSTATVTVTTVSSSSSNANASALASVLMSGVVTVTVSNSSSTTKFTATIAVSTSSTSPTNISSVTVFDYNCSAYKKEQVTFNCSDANVLYNLTCSGEAAARVEQQCPVSQLQCSVIDMNTYSVTDSDYCTVVSSSGSYVVCKCGYSNSSSSSSSGTSSPSSSPTSTSSLSVAVTSEYVAGDFSATVSVVGSMSSATVEDTTSVLATFGGLWLICIFLMASFFLPLNFFSGWSSVVLKVMGLFSSLRAKLWAVMPLNEGQRSEREKLRDEWRRYVTAVLPKVYHPVSWLSRLWSELCDDHEYLKFIVSVIRWHSRGKRESASRDEEKRKRKLDNKQQSKQGSEGWEKAFDVMNLLISFTLSCFLLAWLYDLQYPDDDGSCPQHVTKATCLLRKSPLDSSQTYCSWTSATAVSAGTLVESKHGTVLSTSIISSTLTEDELHQQCQYSEQNASMLATMLVTVIVSFISAVVTNMVSAMVSMMTTPSVEEDDNDGDDKEGGKGKQQGASWRTLSLYFLGELLEMDLLGRVATCRVSEMISDSREVFINRFHELEEDHKIWLHREGRRSFQGYNDKNDLLQRRDEEESVSVCDRQVESLDGRSCVDASLLPVKEGRESVFKMSMSLNKHDQLLELQHKLLHHAVDSNSKAVTLLHAYLYSIVYHRLGDKEAASILWQTIWKGYRLPPPRVSRVVQWMFGLLVVMTVMGALFFIFLKGLNRGSVWQSNFLQACCIQWAMDVVFVSTVEILWVDFGFPGLVYEEVLLGGYAELLKAVDEMWICLRKTARGREREGDGVEALTASSLEKLLRQKVCEDIPEAMMLLILCDVKTKVEAGREGRENRRDNAKVEAMRSARIVPVSEEQPWDRKYEMSTSALAVTRSLSLSNVWWRKKSKPSVRPLSGVTSNEEVEGGEKRKGRSIWFWLLTRLPMPQQRLLVRFLAPIVLAGVILAWSELKQTDKILESMFEAFMVLLILILTSLFVGMSIYNQHKALSSYQLSQAMMETTRVDNDEEKEEADDDEGVVREKVWGEGQMKSDDDNSFVGLDGRESLDALMARIMESQSISYDNSNEEDEDSDSNALSISFIFSSCSSSSIGSGTYISTNMLDHEGTETLVRVTSRRSMSDDDNGKDDTDLIDDDDGDNGYNGLDDESWLSDSSSTENVLLRLSAPS